MAGPADDRQPASMYVAPMASREISLREITGETVRLITALDVAPEQQGLVSPNAVSIAEVGEHCLEEARQADRARGLGLGRSSRDGRARP